MLVIQVEDADDGDYPVRVLKDDGTTDWFERPALVTSLSPILPDPPASLAGVGPIGTAIREAVLGKYAPSGQQLREFGQYLFGLLRRVGVDQAWNGLPEGVLTVFDVRPAVLRQLPWELVVRHGRRSFADAAAPHVRGRLPFATESQMDYVAPITMLIVVGAHDPVLAAEAELAAIGAASGKSPGRFHIETLMAPSRQQLFERIEELRPQVFHFIGHGGFSPGTTTPVLDLVPPGAPQPEELKGEEVRQDFPEWSPRLVVLNACRTTDVATQAGVWSVAEAFGERGTPAVVCMQGDVPSKVAVRFADGFYSALGRGEPVHMAMLAGRREIRRADPASFDGRAWVLPSLELRARPEEVLPVRACMPRADLDMLEQRVVEFRNLRQFVDRGCERRRLWRSLDPPIGGPEHLVLVIGAPETGSTSLVQSCLLTCALRGHLVRYVNLGGGERLSWLDVLYQIRDGTGATGLQRPLPAEAFAEFDREIAYLACGQEPANDSGPAAGSGRRPRFTDMSEHALEFQGRILARFREALARSAGKGLLTVALDHVGGRTDLGGVMAEDMGGLLSSGLFRPVVTGELPNVRIIVVLRDDERHLLAADVGDLAVRVEVRGFSRDEYRPLQREYYARGDYPPDAWSWMEELIEVAARKISVPWKPKLLARFDDEARGGGRS